MILDPEEDSHPEPALLLQTQFRLGELDRTISSRRSLLITVQWLYIPLLMIALAVMIVGLILGWGSFGPVLGGAAVMLGAVLSLFQKAGRLRDDLTDLQEERDSMVAAIQAGSADGLGQIGG